jgi:hypothetical protein
MPIALTLLVLILYASNVAGWTYTEYLTVVTTEGFDLQTTTTAVTVSPTGPVSPTKTEITTAATGIYYGAQYGVFNITVTDLYLGPGASVCTPSNFQFTCSPSTTASMLAGAFNTIETSVWAAVTISNPSTCTQTSFTYTTSSPGILENLGEQVQFPTIFNEAADTGSNGEGLFVTTYISTVSVDLGGQPITTTRCDIWLKNGALESIAPNESEQLYLSNCVDPRRYLCSDDPESSATCGTDWIGTYPMTPGAATGGGAASTTDRGGGPASSSTTKAGGAAGGKDLLSGGLMLTALTAVASLCILLC